MNPAVHPPALAVAGAGKAYGTGTALVPALIDVDVELAAGEVGCLLGPSGCGKSTLLRAIAGLERLDAGTIIVGGARLAGPGWHTPPERRGVGLVFQDHALFPHLTVAANIGFGLDRRSAADRMARVADMVAAFDLAGLEARYPHQLSGGQQQRVAIARALAPAPALLLLDEPFSGLDGHLRGLVRDRLMAMLGAAGTTVLIVTHDPDDAMAVADRLVLMAGGRVLQSADPATCWHRPATLAAARLLGPVNDIGCTVAGGVAQTPFGPLAAPHLADGPARLAFRPDALTSDPAGVAVHPVDARFAGADIVHRLRIGDARVAMALPASGSSESPDRVTLDPARAMLFPAAI